MPTCPNLRFGEQVPCYSRPKSFPTLGHGDHMFRFQAFHLFPALPPFSTSVLPDSCNWPFPESFFAVQLSRCASRTLKTIQSETLEETLFFLLPVLTGSSERPLTSFAFRLLLFSVRLPCLSASPASDRPGISFRVSTSALSLERR